jgi:membrane associated rhomboid family serine protease
MGRMSAAVRSLVILNAIIFAVGLLLPQWDDQMVRAFALWFPRNEQFAPWQLVTYLFLHGGFAHIFFNMFALASFGSLLERQWGARRFLVFYFLCGIGAGVIHAGVSWVEFESLRGRLVEAGLTPQALQSVLASGQYRGPAGDPALREVMVDFYGVYATPTIGASGAIYGILVAFGLLYPNVRLALLFVPVPVAAKYVIPALLALDLLSGVTGFSLFGAGIAHFAHLGGALIGFLLMWHWRDRAHRAVQVV